MARSIYTIALVAIFCVAAVQSQIDDDEFDATTRDKTAKCLRNLKYTPVDEKCRDFEECCDSYYDPLNGDKCQIKQQSCEIIAGQAQPEAQCKLLNCTELITTTTTTTTPRPSFESVNSGISAFTAASLAISFVYHMIVV